jgi:DNA uptake protein ComE-like DNA-binding protein
MSGLRFARCEAENEIVQARALFATLAVAVLCASLAGIPQTSPKAHAIPPPEARVDINYASMDELIKIPGMTRVWAGRIIRFRPSRTKADLIEHGILSLVVYDRVKDYLIAHREKQ